LIFCRLAQDGTGEGIFTLDRMPIAKKREVSAAALENLRALSRQHGFAKRKSTEPEPSQ